MQMTGRAMTDETRAQLNELFLHVYHQALEAAGAVTVTVVYLVEYAWHLDVEVRVVVTVDVG